MLLHAIHNTVVRIRALVLALEPLPALVARYAQRDAVFWTEFLELRHYAGGYYGCGFGVEKVHERFVELQLGVHGVREEVCVYEDGVGGAEGGVGLEEEGGGDLGAGWGVSWREDGGAGRCALAIVSGAYISRFALFSSSFFFASSSPAIWFFLLEQCQYCCREWYWGTWSHTVVHLVGLGTLAGAHPEHMLTIPTILLVCANLRVFFWTPIVAECWTRPFARRLSRCVKAFCRFLGGRRYGSDVAIACAGSGLGVSWW